MVHSQFRKFGLVGSPRNVASYQVHYKIYQYLLAHQCEVYVEQALQSKLTDLPATAFYSKEAVGKASDLIIVVGGDGNMLRAGVNYSKYQIPLIGINKGNLGFLTEIDPDKIDEALYKLIASEPPCYVEQRNLLDACFYHDKAVQGDKYTVVNELALMGTSNNRIIEVEVYINQKFAFSMRGDGLLIGTPTGSTAHNISAGGPIVHGSVSAVILTPLSAHTLTARPIVIPCESEIEIHFKDEVLCDCIDVYADGKLVTNSQQGNRLVIVPSDIELQLLHFNDYNYYQVLASKLGWSKRLF